MQRRHSILFIAVVTLAFISLAGQSLANVMYFNNTANNARTSFIGGTFDTFPTSKGIAFTAGPAGPYSIDVMDVILYADWSNPLTPPPSTFTFNVDLRGVTNTTPALAGAPIATASLSVSVPNTAQFFSHTFTAADLTAFAGFPLQSGQSYSLSFYGASSDKVLLGRNNLAGYGYITTNGFTILNSISGNANYAGAFDVGIGAASAVPEPSTYALLCISLGAVGFARRKMMMGERDCEM